MKIQEKIQELEQKLKARDHYYSVVIDVKAKSFLIYYSFAGLPDFDSYGESRLPLFYVCWNDYDKLWRIQIDLFFDQKYTDVILYPLKLLKNLDNPIFCSDDCVLDYLQVDSLPVEDFDE